MPPLQRHPDCFKSALQSGVNFFGWLVLGLGFWLLVAQIWLRLFLTPAASYPGSKWFCGILGVVGPDMARPAFRCWWFGFVDRRCSTQSGSFPTRYGSGRFEVFLIELCRVPVDYWDPGSVCRLGCSGIVQSIAWLPRYGSACF